MAKGQEMSCDISLVKDQFSQSIGSPKPQQKGQERKCIHKAKYYLSINWGGYMFSNGQEECGHRFCTFKNLISR